MFDLGPTDPSYNLYAVGDIHGCLDCLLDAENRIQHDIGKVGRPGLVIYLGDYVDKGPRSSEVLEHLSDKSASSLRRIMLCGNHDDLFLEFVKSPGNVEQWLQFGGRDTLLSYGVDADHVLLKGGGRGALADIVSRAVPSHHVTFLEELPIAGRIGSHFFVHAGIRPGVPLNEQDEHDMMWIRDGFLRQPQTLDITVVYGHTVVPEAAFSTGRIGIDTGAYATGRLTVLRVSQGKASVL